MTKRWNIWHILGFHTCSNSTEVGDFGLGGEIKIEYPSPWSLFGIIYNHYLCKDCGRKYWMPKGNFEEFKANEIFIKQLTSLKGK